jgi:hypothetical protein
MFFSGEQRAEASCYCIDHANGAKVLDYLLVPHTYCNTNPIRILKRAHFLCLYSLLRLAPRRVSRRINRTDLRGSVYRTSPRDLTVPYGDNTFSGFATVCWK